VKASIEGERRGTQGKEDRDGRVKSAVVCCEVFVVFVVGSCGGSLE